jgi:hypothetical protein
MAYDDPMIMAEEVLAGRAFVGTCMATNVEHRETKPGNTRPSPVPLVTVRTAQRPPLPIDSTVWWATHRVKGQIRAVTPAQWQAQDEPGDRPYLVEVALLAGHQRGRLVPVAGERCTLANLDPNPTSPPRPAVKVPWTHLPQETP